MRKIENEDDCFLRGEEEKTQSNLLESPDRLENQNPQDPYTF
jgi:hypothetical protein